MTTIPPMPAALHRFLAGHVVAEQAARHRRDPHGRLSDAHTCGCGACDEARNALSLAGIPAGPLDSDGHLIQVELAR